MKATVILIAAFALAGIGAGAGGAAANKDQVSGAGATTLVDPGAGLNEHDQFSASASSNADGSDPRGHVALKLDDLASGTTTHYRGDVSEGCLIVDGDTAVAVGKLPESQQFEVPGFGIVDYLAVSVVDNGNDDQGSAILLFDRTAQRVCAGQALPTFPLDHGNFVVKDAS